MTQVLRFTERDKSAIRKPNIFKRWLYKCIKEAHSYEIDEDKPQLVKQEYHELDQSDRCIRFSVYYANGGRVIETARYDRNRDKRHQGLYIITSEQDFGKEIDKIITMESLKQ